MRLILLSLTSLDLKKQVGKAKGKRKDTSAIIYLFVSHITGTFSKGIRSFWSTT
ncbi:hypothetical protein I306_05678 [Cryptococcus gattii EJB2]|uniref:Transposase n=1 Tax=Cryptococcus gattii EJB2 TaxID=1296103 RepID=A0ABR5BNT7_9TREE|nr:hypothetical protein I306_05678 [Cryptococcus gattii EJB2]